MISDRRTTSRDDFARAASNSADSNSDSAGKEPAASMQAILAELLAQGATYFSAQRDLFQLRLRSMAIALIVGFLALIAAISLVAATAVLLVLGIAGGLAAAFELPLWAGQLIASTSLVGMGALSLYTVLTYLRYRSFQLTIAKYERRRTAGHRRHVSTGAPDG